VAISVTITVRITPRRSASTPQANLPAAPPAKTSISATPTARTVDPLAMSRKGRKVRKPVRVEESITWMRDRAWKPRRSRMPQSEPETRSAVSNETGTWPMRRLVRARSTIAAATRPIAA